MTIELKHIVGLPEHLLKGIQYHLGGSLFTAKPRMVQFPVCDRCNARCIMCNRWKKASNPEIGIEKIREVFSSALFSKVEQVSIHGGEPTLRSDLADICRAIQSGCPRLKRLWISTNGFGSGRIMKRMREVLDVLDFKQVEMLEINVSIDGIGETHNRIRGVKGGFDQALETIKSLKALGNQAPVRLTIGTVIQPLNLHELDNIENFAASLSIPVVFQPLMFDQFFSLQGPEMLRFDQKDMALFEKVVEDKLAPGCSTTNFYWDDFLDMRSGMLRKSPCAFDRYVLSLYPTGEVLPCSREEWILFGNVYDKPVDEIWYSQEANAVRKRMKAEVCPTCSNYCAVEYSLQKEFYKYLVFYIKRRFLQMR